MEQITAEARAEGVELGQVKRRIDGKGIVLFTLESGGTIRDTGKEIFFSVHDPKAELMALRYAVKKWGKRFDIEQGRIIFHLESELERPTPDIQKSVEAFHGKSHEVETHRFVRLFADESLR